ncbi:putative condensin, partial [Emiliania huxleyi CCMP1516]|uniref:Condensin-2 complex subunit G2 n=2 Tax=Emiliania huxleyi TaxID=2903 RepID=A0A0D3I364_EMIH1
MNRAEALLLELESSASKLVELAPTAGESLQGFSAHEVERLSEALAVHVHAALAAAAPAFDAAPEGSSAVSGESVEGALGILAAAAAIARAIAVEPSFGIPEKLQAVAEALHDIIFDLHDPRASTLQGAIVELCESWWLAERPGRDELVPQTISYLLVSALHEAATAADVKRLWALRSALGVLDYADPSVAALKRLLLHCMIKPLVLRCAEGRKLLVYLFGLHPPFIAELHRAIKAQIPVCRKSLRDLYGEIYFRAWRAASGASSSSTSGGARGGSSVCAYLERLEEGCLQDLMFHAVHAASANMATALRQVLAYTHAQKRQRGVDSMLLRLYEPILWRALKVANPH